MMKDLIKQIEKALDQIHDHRYYTYDKPFNPVKIGGVEASHEEATLIAHGQTSSIMAQQHLTQALHHLEEEQKFIEELFQSKNERASS